MNMLILQLWLLSASFCRFIHLTSCCVYHYWNIEIVMCIYIYIFVIIFIIIKGCFCLVTEVSHPCFLSIVSLGLKEAITILGSCHDLQQMLQFAVMIVLYSSQWVLGVIDLRFRKVRKVCKDTRRSKVVYDWTIHSIQHRVARIAWASTAQKESFSNQNIFGKTNFWSSNFAGGDHPSHCWFNIDVTWSVSKNISTVVETSQLGACFKAQQSWLWD